MTEPTKTASVDAEAGSRVDAFSVTLDEAMDVREGEWDGQRGREDLRRYGEREDGSIDWERASRGYTVFDLNPEGRDPVQADGKLPVAYVEDDQLVGIGNGIRNALARLSQTEGLSDQVEAQARNALEGLLEKLNRQTSDAFVSCGIHADAAMAMVSDVSDRLLALRDVERSEEERAQIREEFPRLITATPSQMRAWSESPFAGQNRKEGEARASARAALSRVLALKEKPMGEWDEGDYDDAVRAISFVKRMSEVEQGDPVTIEGREGPSDRDASLRDWGHWTDAPTNAADKMPTIPRRRMLSSIAAIGMAGALGLPLTADSPTDQAAGPERVYRWSRIDVHLDDRQSEAIGHAIEIAERTAGRSDAVTIKSVADELRADGFEDYLSPEGFRAEVWAARTGVQPYSNGRDTWGEFRSKIEVEDSLPSWALKAFTDDHPPELVTPSNYRQYAVGTVGQDAHLVEGPDGQQYVKVTIFVGDLATLRKIRDGKVELSAGYTVIPVEDRGVDPISGQSYRYRQTKIRINHLALVEAGRAGPLARINVDGAWEVPTEDHTDMKKIDQLTPEQGAMLISSLASYLEPESPDAQSAALEAIASMVGMDPETIAESLGRFVESPEEMEPMMDVEIIDGLTVKMTEDQQANWQATRATADAAQVERDDLKSQLASRDAAISTLERAVGRLTADLEARARAQLIDSVESICPDLVAGWRKIGDDVKIVESCKPLTLGQNSDGKIVESPMAAMQRAVVCDLDPDAAAAFESAIGTHAENWDAHVKASFDTTIRLCRSRSTKTDGTAKPNADALSRNQVLSLVRTGQVAAR